MLERVNARTVGDLEDFLCGCDLTTSALDAPTVVLWVQRAGSRIVGSTGYELSREGGDALIRSVAVAREARLRGQGTVLARFAMEQAHAAGARVAWLFSRRSGPFWQGLGFEESTTDALAVALAGTAQVELFRSSGQLLGERAWRKELSPRAVEARRGDSP